MGEGGSVGARGGLDADAAFEPWAGRVRFDARASPRGHFDAMRPERSGPTLALVGGAAVKLGPIATLHVDGEFDHNSVAGNRFRASATLAIGAAATARQLRASLLWLCAMTLAAACGMRANVSTLRAHPRVWERSNEGRGPSRAIVPTQPIPLRFDHRRHLAIGGVTCERCHSDARSSQQTEPSLDPSRGGVRELPRDRPRAARARRDAHRAVS